MLKKNLILSITALLMLIGCNEKPKTQFKIDYEKIPIR